MTPGGRVGRAHSSAAGLAQAGAIQRRRLGGAGVGAQLRQVQAAARFDVQPGRQRGGADRAQLRGEPGRL